MLALKADKSDSYTKSEIDSKIVTTDLTNYYKKNEIDTKLSLKTDFTLANSEFNVLHAMDSKLSDDIVSVETELNSYKTTQDSTNTSV